MNPYPTRAELSTEAAADRLLTEQAVATAAFHAIVLAAKAAIDKLEFPLGCPVRGYDEADITGLLAEWLEPRDAKVLEQLADDAVASAWSWRGLEA